MGATTTIPDRAMLVSFHCRRSSAGAGEMFTRGFAAVLRRVFADGLAEIYHDDPADTLEWDGLRVRIARRSSLEMAVRLASVAEVGRLAISWDGPNDGNARNRRLLVLDGVGFARLLKVGAGRFGRSFIVHHNFEPDYYADAAKGTLRRWLFMRAGAAETRQAMRNASLNLFLTRQDKEKAQAFCGAQAGRAEVLGVFEAVTPLVPAPLSGSDQVRVLITGDLSMRKGSLGLGEFLETARSRRAALEPHVRFVVGGRNPAPALLALAAPPFIEIVANPPSITDLALRADVYLNPNYTGSGIKMRNFDGLRHGLPVFCRIENAAGFDHLGAPAFRTFASIDDGLTRLASLDRGEVVTERCRQAVWSAYESAYSLDRGEKWFRQLLERDVRGQ
jgi:hypothetical protein